MKSTVKNIKKMIDRFEDLQEKHKNCGAYDTEPSYLFQDCIQKAFRNDVVDVPQTVAAWDLYSDCTGSVVAAKSLSCLATKICWMIVAFESKEDGLRECLTDYCWRVQI